MKRSLLHVASLSLLLGVWACVGSQKSATPLSPSIAGPIAGVNISAPAIVSPTINARISTMTQPVTLRVTNGTSNGVRPIGYSFQVATDPNFGNVVLTHGLVPQDPSGTTSAVLPQALPPDRTYYWRARAEDGANSSLYSAPGAFVIFTPVIFGAPRPLEPVGGSSANQQPTFVIANAPVSGPAGVVIYRLEISSSRGFGSLVAAYEFPQSPVRSELTTPVPLPPGTYYWRVRAYDAGFQGPFSETQSFVAAFAGGGSTGGGDPGKPCGPPYPTTPIGILECRRSQYPTNWTKLDQLAFLRGSAKDMNAAGVPGGPFGILRKESGNNCGGFSCDIICVGQGNSQLQYDVLLNEQIPNWGSPHGHPDIREDECVVQ